jgi:hypothetical protein
VPLQEFPRQFGNRPVFFFLVVGTGIKERRIKKRCSIQVVEWSHAFVNRGIHLANEKKDASFLVQIDSKDFQSRRFTITPWPIRMLWHTSILLLEEQEDP